MRVAFLDMPVGRMERWRTVLRALASGTPGAAIMSPGQFEEDFDDFDVMVHFEYEDCLPAITMCRRAKKPHYWIENAYVGASMTSVAPTAWFRITRNSNQARWTGEALDPERWDRNFAKKVKLAAWHNYDPETIIVCKAASDWHRFILETKEDGNEALVEWEDNAIRFAQARCRLMGSELIVRPRKPLPRVKLIDLLARTRAVVITHASVAAVEAIVAGHPVMVSEHSVCHQFSRWNWSNLWRGDRRPLLDMMAWGQFTIDEMRSGFAWDRLTKNP